MVILKLGIVCTVMLFLVGCAPSTIPPFQNAEHAYNRGDYSTALKKWQLLAEQGDANAQYNLGKLYYHGWGVPQDNAQARDWWRKAAAQGHLDAQKNLVAVSQYWLDKLAMNKVQPVRGADMSIDDTLAYINEILKEHDKHNISIQGLGKIFVRYSDNTLNGEAYGADIERVGQRDEWVYLLCKKEVGNCWKTIFGSMKVIWFQMGDHNRNPERLVKAFTHLITKIVEESAPPHRPFDDSPLVPKSQRPIPLVPPQIPSSDKSTLDSMI